MTLSWRWGVGCALLLMLILGGGGVWSSAHASCGSASCFVVIGSQQAVSPAGVLTANLIYTNTPNEIPPDGANTIPFANQQTKQLILANSQVNQLKTLVQTATLDLNYGFTERFGVQVTVPYRMIHSIGQIGAGQVSDVDNKGIGDVMARLKYNLLPTLRSMVIFEMGVSFPTGDYQADAVPGQLAESTLQVGKGAFGFQPGFYQTYEVLPHRLNQFFMGNWRYNLRNPDGYQFGQEYTLNAGMNLVTVPWLTLTGQLNFRYKTKDNIEAALYQFEPSPINRAVLIDGNVIGRPVPTTNSTYLAFSTGVMVNLWDFAQAYGMVQIPMYRNFNGNLQQATSYVFGLTKHFAMSPLFKA